MPENDPTPPGVYIIQWSDEPMPKEQWCVDRFWPFVEVYVAWGDALRRWGELRDKGIPARMSEEARPIPPGSGDADSGGQA